MATQDQYKARMDAYLKADFDPPSNPNQMISQEIRMRNAAEYSTHQLGRIRQALERIAAAVEKIADKP